MNVNSFQIIALAVLAILFVGTLLAAHKWIGRRGAAFWCLVWIAAGVAVVWPDLTTQIAKKLGVSRGLNLLVYTSVVVMLVGFMMIYARLRKLRRDMTLLVRELAIRDAEAERPAAPSSSPSPDAH